MINFSVLNNKAHIVAPRLLGCELVRIFNGKVMRARIVETEAYDQTDSASHSYKGLTKRNTPMFGPAGRAYVYFTYGMHHCFNIVTDEDGYGSAVLIRAVEPIKGVEIMQSLRPQLSVKQLSNGPAKLTRALAITKDFNSHNLSKKPLQLVLKPPIKDQLILKSYRIGITKNINLKWRFYIKNNDYVSFKRYQK